MMFARAAMAAVSLAWLAVPAQAQQMVYEGSSYGTGTGKCSGYRMSVEVAVNGSDVHGKFQQDGRPQRNFEAKADASGAFKTEAVVGGGGTMAVTGNVGPNGGAVLLDGYCRFSAPLARRQQ